MFDGVPGFWEQVRKSKNNFRPAKKCPNHIRSHNTTGNALILYTNQNMQNQRKINLKHKGRQAKNVIVNKMKS